MSALLLLLMACSPKTPPAAAAAAPEEPAPARINYAARSAYLHAQVAWSRGELEEAERYLRRALAFDPRSAQLNGELAELQAQRAQ